ncbi:MAG: FtsX-like permease family protein [Nitriliruptorales bacterium]|nr:FtsX-like permease family protein [Nitriliruptorales bacterium]
MATSSAETDAIARAAMGLLSPADPNSVVVQTSPELNHMRDAIRAGLGQSARQLLALVLLSGLILVALTVFANVTARRKDFGRRRALGASRSEIVLLVAGRTVVVAVMGAVVGASVGSAIVWIWTSAPPPPGFSIAVAFLSSLAAALGAVGPAAVAAFRDPVKVLRMP